MVGFSPCEHPVDLYTTVEGDYIRIFIDMYHPEIPPLSAKAPEGFILVE